MKLKYGIAMAAIAGLVFVGCGEDDPPASNNNNTVAPNNPNNTNNITTPTNNANNTNNVTTPTNNPNNTNNITMLPDAPPNCDPGPNRPARCDESPVGFDWGVASIVDFFAVAESDDDCCFDYTGDGVNDNALGGLLTGLADVNPTIAEGIDSGSIVIILEHAGLAALTGGDFTINFWLGAWDTITEIAPAGGNTVLIDPTSIDEGAQPQAYVPEATLTAAGAVSAGPGTISIAIDLLGTNLALTISGAQITASVDAANTSLDTGVALADGTIGGYVTGQDLSNAVNLYVKSSCECLGITNNGDLLTWVQADGTATCADISGSTCPAGDTCGTLGGSCGLLFILAEPDVDVDGDGTPDALSIGARFTAAGAVITGVSDPN